MFKKCQYVEKRLTEAKFYDVPTNDLMWQLCRASSAKACPAKLMKSASTLKSYRPIYFADLHTTTES